MGWDGSGSFTSLWQDTHPSLSGSEGRLSRLSLIKRTTAMRTNEAIMRIFFIDLRSSNTQPVNHLTRFVLCPSTPHKSTFDRSFSHVQLDKKNQRPVIYILMVQRFKGSKVVGARHKARGVRNSMGTKYPTSCILHLASSIQYPVSSIQYPASSIQHRVSSIHHPSSKERTGQ